MNTLTYVLVAILIAVIASGWRRLIPAGSGEDASRA